MLFIDTVSPTDMPIMIQDFRESMRKDLGAKTILYPMPVLILAAYREDGRVDAMNAAWGGIADKTLPGADARLLAPLPEKVRAVA